MKMRRRLMEIKIEKPEDVQTIKEIPYGNQKIILTAKTFKGTRYFDLRLWFVNQGGSPCPTQKGINLRTEKLNEVISALCDLSEMESLK